MKEMGTDVSKRQKKGTKEGLHAAETYNKWEMLQFSYFESMKKLLTVILAFAITSGFGQRLIVRGDDMGYSHSGNLALIKCSKEANVAPEGIQTSIEIIVPSPWFPEP